MKTMASEGIREIVQARYGEAAKAVGAGAKTSCCGSRAAAPLEGADPITRDLYSAEEAALVPGLALSASFGCGNPTALAELRPGEVVLDLGSGGGIDVLLSARRVGPTGKAYGLDMTPEMLELARRNQAEAGAENVEFLEGHIEAIPLPDASVDVIISNCVINLTADKDRALGEAFRVLRPGGRLAISDVVLRRELPEAVRRSMELWTGCVAGALLEEDYRGKLATAGFADVSVEPTRVFGREDAEEMAAQVTSSSCCGGAGVEQALSGLDGAVMSAFLRARKP
jgi:SAM-dependent methyltransferase